MSDPHSLLEVPTQDIRLGQTGVRLVSDGYRIWSQLSPDGYQMDVRWVSPHHAIALPVELDIDAEHLWLLCWDVLQNLMGTIRWVTDGCAMGVQTFKWELIRE